jgi:hypothetical protein
MGVLPAAAWVGGCPDLRRRGGAGVARRAGWRWSPAGPRATSSRWAAGRSVVADTGGGAGDLLQLAQLVSDISLTSSLESTLGVHSTRSLRP